MVYYDMVYWSGIINMTGMSVVRELKPINKTEEDLWFIQKNEKNMQGLLQGMIFSHANDCVYQHVIIISLKLKCRVM